MIPAKCLLRRSYMMVYHLGWQLHHSLHSVHYKVMDEAMKTLIKCFHNIITCICCPGSVVLLWVLKPNSELVKCVYFV